MSATVNGNGKLNGHKNGKSAKKKQLPAKQGEGNYRVGDKKPPLHSRWKKGESGNAAGPKPGFRTLTDAAKALMGERISKGKNAPTFAEAIISQVAKIVLKATVSPAGKVSAATFVRDTAEGKPAQRLEMSGSLGITQEQQRQVRFLVHTIKATQRDLGDGVTIEEIYQVVEARELEVFGEDVSGLRPAVFAALGEESG